MLGAICGDIIGSPYEFGNIKTTRFPLFIDKCHPTDDSIMTLAVASALMKVDERPSSIQGQKAISKAVAREMRRVGFNHMDVGYGGKFRKWLEGRIPDGYGSWGNGSAMRVSPVAWRYEYITEVLWAAEATCLPTHNSPEGIRGAKAIAAATFLARKGADKDYIRRYVEDNFYYDLNTPIDMIRPTYSFDVSCAGSVPVAIRSFLESTDYEDCIRKVISLGGDCDTTAAMAGAIAEAYYGGVPDAIAKKCREMLSPDLIEILEAWEAAGYGKAKQADDFKERGREIHRVYQCRFGYPYYDRDRGVYVAPGLDGADAYEDEDFLDFAETMCMEGLIFHYDYHDAVQHIEDFPDHQHSIEGVLRAVMDDPETFFVPEGCEHEYSEQELKLVMAWQQALLAMKANSEDDPDHQ